MADKHYMIVNAYNLREAYDMVKDRDRVPIRHKVLRKSSQQYMGSYEIEYQSIVRVKKHLTAAIKDEQKGQKEYTALAKEVHKYDAYDAETIRNIRDDERNHEKELKEIRKNL